VVTESLVLFSALVPPSIEVRTKIDPDVPMVLADATLAGDVVMNLCTNAYQSMQGTNGVLTVGLRHSQPNVELWVSDTGHGMNQATVERIFEPFFTTRSVGQGTGLGLSIVHGILESFGASIAVETAPGTGTTFVISFPAVAPMSGSAAPDSG
jgi:signal transduction histidine kinase